MRPEDLIADAERRVTARMLREAVRADFFGGLHVDPNKVPVLSNNSQLVSNKWTPLTMEKQDESSNC